MSTSQLTFKIASHPDEFEQIHRLNYRTFVEEIPQHPQNPEKILIDKFHSENTYCICLDGQRLVAMLAIRGNRPFSLDQKVPDLDRWLPPSQHLCEIRLLAVELEYRGSALLVGLLHFAAVECIRRGYTMAVASGTLRQTRLYAHLGFISFAEPVGTVDACYQPMYLPLHAAVSFWERMKKEIPEVPVKVSFLPGPVEISASVRDAFNAPAISHRSEEFLQMVNDTKRLLCNLTGAHHVQLLLGSGTLANDAVAAQLKMQAGAGLILSNGEFGERLIDHAHRMGLEFEVIGEPWGRPHDLVRVERRLHNQPQISWLWSTHCETSCGLLNDAQSLLEICRRRGVKLCLDCISSIGTVAVNLSEVFLASGVSGKGLASYAGIGLVFHNDLIEPDKRIPRYLDLGYYQSKQGVPYTHSSNLIAALQQALLELNVSRRFESIRSQHELLRQKLSAYGIPIMATEYCAAPAVISLQLPRNTSSRSLGEKLERRGFMLSYCSEYLLERNIIQICLMGKLTEQQCHDLANNIADICS